MASYRSLTGALKRLRSRGLRTPKSVLSEYLEADLEAKAGKQLGYAQVAASKERTAEYGRQFDVTTGLKKDEIAARKRAAKYAGAGQLVMGAYTTQALATEGGVGKYGPIELAKTAYRSITGKGAADVATDVAGKGVQAQLVPLTGGRAPGYIPAAEVVAEGTASGVGPAIGGRAPGYVPKEGAGGITGMVGPAIAGIGANFIARKAGANQELSNSIGGAVSGYMIGAKMGSVGGPVGAVVGAVIGFVVGEIFDAVSVVCTELHRQRYIDEETLRKEAIFGKSVDDFTYLGYRHYADPIVKKMKKSKRYTKLVAKIALPIIKEIGGETNLPGKIGLRFGSWLCRRKGRQIVAREIAGGITWA